MGISGLLPIFKSIQKPCHVKKFSGQIIGIDGYGWLHRGVYSCTTALALDKPTRKYVDFALHRVNMLIHYGVIPYVVFDGDYLPSKSHTENDRATKRAEARRVGMELLRQGKTTQAQSELQKAIDVTAEMAKLFIDELKKRNVKYLVAPYEADSQLVYLEKMGIIHGIISEDSDLLVFGAQLLITKLDQFGEATSISRNDFTSCRELSFVGWTDGDFRTMAILSGCDYLKNIPGLGLKKAYGLVKKYRKIDRILRHLQFEKSFRVPSSYQEAFVKAEQAFLYQWVFCPIDNQMKNLTPIPDQSVIDPANQSVSIKINEMFHIGHRLDDKIAHGVAVGDLHPHTKKPLNARPYKTDSAKEFNRSTVNGYPSQRISSAPPIEKGARSIISYMKPGRTPLAELDANLFCLSAKQEEILQDNSQRSWVSSAVDNHRSVLYTSSKGSSQIPGQRTCSTPVLGSVRDNLDGVSNRTKRPRIFSDKHVSPPLLKSPKLETGRSKYFPSSEDFVDVNTGTGPSHLRHPGVTNPSLAASILDLTKSRENSFFSNFLWSVPPRGQVTTDSRKFDVFVDDESTTGTESSITDGELVSSSSSVSSISSRANSDSCTIGPQPLASIPGDNEKSGFDKSNGGDSTIMTKRLDFTRLCETYIYSPPSDSHVDKRKESPKVLVKSSPVSQRRNLTDFGINGSPKLCIPAKSPSYSRGLAINKLRDTSTRDSGVDFDCLPNINDVFALSPSSYSPSNNDGIKLINKEERDRVLVIPESDIALEADQVISSGRSTPNVHGESDVEHHPLGGTQSPKQSKTTVCRNDPVSLSISGEMKVRSSPSRHQNEFHASWNKSDLSRFIFTESLC